ncbi:hypothetical protein I5U30_18450 [Stenotrophomonas maltophilia]|nr:hypothetical protein [Stenotrophomonas maltophilia]
MAAESDWTVFPGKGLGRLKFGMSAAQVNALSGTYGAVTGRGNDRVPDDILHDTLEKFGAAMSNEEKQALISLYTQNGPSADIVTETRGNPGLILGYQDDRLAEIMPAQNQRPLFLDGKDVLSIGALESLALLERLNGGPGRYAATEAAFDNLAMSVDGFCVADPITGVRMLDEADKRFAGRTVTLRAEPYLPEGEMDRFVIRSVLK